MGHLSNYVYFRSYFSLTQFYQKVRGKFSHYRWRPMKTAKLGEKVWVWSGFRARVCESMGAGSKGIDSGRSESTAIKTGQYRFQPKCTTNIQKVSAKSSTGNKGVFNTYFKAGVVVRHYENECIFFGSLSSENREKWAYRVKRRNSLMTQSITLRESLGSRRAFSSRL